MSNLLGRTLCVLAYIVLCPVGHASDGRVDTSVPIAHIGEQPITLKALDSAGGRAVYDAANQLYEARVRALYQLLSTEVLQREASLRKLTETELLDQSVSSQPRPITDGDVDSWLISQRVATPQDPKTRKQAQLYLGMKLQADAKREFIAGLFDKHRVRVSLPVPDPPPAEEIRGAHEPVLGKSTAPVAIIAFSDYQCPYCRELSLTFDTLLQRFPDELKIIYRHYPLGEASERWSHAALCADEQNQFVGYHHRLFASDLRSTTASQLASELGLEAVSFEACMAEQRHRRRLQDDKQEGRRLNIQGTPTLFVAGRRFRGAQTLERLSQAVEQARTDASASRLGKKQ